MYRHTSIRANIIHWVQSYWRTAHHPRSRIIIPNRHSPSIVIRDHRDGIVSKFTRIATLVMKLAYPKRSFKLSSTFFFSFDLFEARSMNKQINGCTISSVSATFCIHRHLFGSKLETCDPYLSQSSHRRKGIASKSICVPSSEACPPSPFLRPSPSTFLVSPQEKSSTTSMTSNQHRHRRTSIQPHSATNGSSK